MRNEALDTFARQAAKLLSRRTTLQSVSGGAVGALLGHLNPQAAEARKRRKRKKRRKKKQCTAECCQNADCGPLKLCAEGQCVVGQGTCPDEANTCGDAVVPCGLMGSNCLCFRSTVGEVRCGGPLFLGLCGECVNDADCEELHPDVPGVFCVQGGGICACGAHSACLDPCPQ